MTAPNVGTAEPEFVEDILDDEGLEPTPAAPAASEAAPSPEASPSQTPPTSPESGTSTQPSAEPAIAQAPPGSEPAAVSGATEPQYPAFSVKGDGQTFEIPGSKVGADGVFLPKDVVPEIEHMIAQGIAHQGSWRQREQAYQTRISQLESARSSKERTADATMQALLKLRAAGPQAFVAWFDDFDRNFDLLMKDAQIEAMKAQYEQTSSRVSEYELERESESLVPQMTSAAENAVAQLAKTYPGVDTQGLLQEVLRGDLFDRVFIEATQAHVQQGLARKVGEVLVDWRPLERYAQREHQLLTRSRTAATQAVQTNTRALATPRTPPTVAAQGSGTPGVATKPLPKTKQELTKWLDSGDWKGSFPT